MNAWSYLYLHSAIHIHGMVLSQAQDIRVEVFWVVTLCSVVVGCQRFRGRSPEDVDVNLHLCESLESRIKHREVVRAVTSSSLSLGW